MKAYIASPFFNAKQVSDVENIKGALRDLDLNYFSPKDENLVKPFDDDNTITLGFKKNISEIDNCHFMIANTNGKDMGTLFECGFAYAHHVPIIYFCEGLKGPFNLMLSKSAAAVATNHKELVEHLKGIKQTLDYFDEYKSEIE